MIGENATGRLFMIMDGLCLIAVLFFIWHIVKRRRRPTFPPVAAVVCGLLYLSLWLPLRLSSDLLVVFDIEGGTTTNPYILCLLIIHWPVMQFISWAAYPPPPPGEFYVDFPLIWGRYIWWGGLCFYFWGTVVVTGFAKGLSRAVTALTTNSTVPSDGAPSEVQ